MPRPVPRRAVSEGAHAGGNLQGKAFVASRGGGSTTGLANSSDHDTVKHNGGSTFLFADGHAKWHKGNPPVAPSTYGTNSPNVYAANVPFSISGQNPTFHAQDGVTVDAPSNAD